MMIRGLRRGQPGTDGRRKLRTKVVAGVVAITLAVLAVFDFAAVTALKKYLVGQTDVSLKSALTVTKPRLDQLLPAFSKAQMVRAGVVSWSTLPNVGAYTIEWVPAKGAVVALQGGPGLTPPAIAKLNYYAQANTVIAAAGVKGQVFSDGKARQVINIQAAPQFRVVSMAVPGQAGTLVAGTNLSDVNNTVRQLELIVGAGSAGAALLIFLGVGLVMRRGLRPIEQMAHQADRISAGDLTERVAPTDSGTEVGRLGSALNGMLGRIQTSVAEREASQEVMRSFFADASHELRTPLASLCANAELYQQGALTERSQVDEAMRRITLEGQRMSRLVDDMLRLARLDQHPDQRRDLVDLTALVGKCVERAQVADSCADLAGRDRARPGRGGRRGATVPGRRQPARQRADPHARGLRRHRHRPQRRQRPRHGRSQRRRPRCPRRQAPAHLRPLLPRGRLAAHRVRPRPGHREPDRRRPPGRGDGRGQLPARAAHHAYPARLAL